MNRSYASAATSNVTAPSYATACAFREHSTPLDHARMTARSCRCQRVKAGQAFYWAPGHAPEALEDVEYVDFSPTEGLNAVLDHIKQQAA